MNWKTSFKRILPHFIPNFGTIVIVLALIWAQQAGAFGFLAPNSTSTTTISYQGRLADSGGSPITDTVGMTFRIYNVASGGSALWTEVYPAVTINDGLFHVLLGSTEPLSADLFSDNDTLYLGITVGADNEMTPREQLASAPYAMTVADASITTDKIADGSVTTSKLSQDIHTIHMFAQPVMVLNNTQTPVPGNPAWVNLDLSQYVPSTATSVLLGIGVAPVNSGARLSISKLGSTGEPSLLVETVDSWDFSQGWCNLSNQLVQYQAYGFGGDLYFYIQIVGYLE